MMKTTLLRSCASILVLLATATGCLGSRFDREAMLGRVVDEVVLPGQIALMEAAEVLDASARAFVAVPDAEALEALRSDWLSAALAWKRVEMFELPGLLLIHNAIERRPARVEFIEGQIAAAADSSLTEMDASFIEPLGSTSKGLSAIEYLVFESDDHASPVLEAFQDPARGAYLTALTDNLVAKTGELHRFWTPEGEDYAGTFRTSDSEGADINGSISLLANQMIEAYETVMQMKIGMPMGRTTDGVPDPSSVESPLSGRSMELLAANLESIRATFDAGFGEYVDHLDRRPPGERLAESIPAQFGNVFETLGRFEGPLETAIVEQGSLVAESYEAMRVLLVLLKTDMAAQLGITVTFSDADGD